MKSPVNIGQELVDVVPLDDVWVTASFKETQLASSRASRPLDNCKKTPLSGHTGLEVGPLFALYGSGKLTLARAAREARVSLWEMMDYVKTKKITAQYDLEDFQRGLKTVAASQRR
jgi:hypothetical protein